MNNQNSNIQNKIINGKPCFVKNYIPGGWLQNIDSVKYQAGMEVEMIERLEPLFQKFPEFGRLKIVEKDFNIPRIVTETIPGDQLQNYLFNSKEESAAQECENALFLAGKWLKIFQTMSMVGAVVEKSPTNPDNLIDYCDLRLNTLMQLKYKWPDTLSRNKVLKWLEHKLDNTPDFFLKKVWCHGDFGAVNMIWDGHVLTPIDFATVHFDLPMVDLTYLIHRIEMLRYQFPWRKWPVQKWTKAILSGYALPNAQQMPIYQALMMKHLLCRLQSLVRRKGVNLQIIVRNFIISGCVTLFY